MARIKDESVERVKATMEILPLVEDVVRFTRADLARRAMAVECHRVPRGS